MATIPKGKKQIMITLPDNILNKLDQLSANDPLLDKRSKQAAKIIIENIDSYFKEPNK